MSTIFQKDFDTLLSDLLTDYKNLDSAPDVTEGSPVFIKGSVSAAAHYGLYRYQDYLAKQLFVDTMDTNNLNHAGAIYGITRNLNESDSDYAQRIISALQTPGSGGTALDYHNWALASVLAPGIPANRRETFLPGAVDTGTNKITLDAVTNPLGWVNADPIVFTSTGSLPTPLVVGTTYYSVYINATTIQVAATSGGTLIVLTDIGTGNHTIAHAATVGDPNAFYIVNAKVVTPNDTISPSSPGTVIVALVPDDESIIDPANQYHAATAALQHAAYTYIESHRPITAFANVIAMETINKTIVGNLTMDVTSGSTVVNVAQVKSDVEAYINSLMPGDILYQVQLEAIALRNGAINATVTSSGFTSGKVIPSVSTEAIRSTSVTIYGV